MDPTDVPTRLDGQRPLAIIVVGDDPLARAVAQLARAAGHDVVAASATGHPAGDEPWHQGVTWRTVSDADSLTGCLTDREIAVVSPAAGARLSISDAFAALEPSDRPRRLVWLSEHRAEGANFEGIDEIAILVLPEFDESSAPRPSDSGDAVGPIPVAQAAMAALRAAVEPDRTGHFEPERVAELGRAVMLQ